MQESEIHLYPTYLSLVALFVSGLWIYSGYDDISKGKPNVGFSWQFIGVAIMVAFACNSVITRNLGNLIVSLCAIFAELLFIRWLSKKTASK